MNSPSPRTSRPSEAELRALVLAARPGGLWLDSGANGRRAGRRRARRSLSYVACEPVVWLRGVGDILDVLPGPAGDRGWMERVLQADPGPGPSFERLAAIGRRLRLPGPLTARRRGATLPPARPVFRGGFAGSFSFDLGRRFEQVPDSLPAGCPWDFFVGLYDEVLELREGVAEPVVHCLAGAEGRLDALWRGVDLGPAAGLAASLDALEGSSEQPEPELDAAEHSARVEQIRELIAAGSLYQANLTLRFRAARAPGPAPLATFWRLRQDNPAPFAAWLDLPGLSVVSASPESFLDLERSGLVRSRPIKGTAARAPGERADRAARRALLASIKDRSELSMIVDLVRNDIGRVCVPGSVGRDARLRAEAHPTVWHLVGDVRGRLAPRRDAFDLLQASFPPGSCIGAPKIQAMTELESLERSRRGPYTGALGWLGLDGSMSLSVAIRTLLFDDTHVTYGVGGGIVYDSVAEAEWQEALLKGHALACALRPRLPGSAGSGRDLDLGMPRAKMEPTYLRRDASSG